MGEIGRSGVLGPDVQHRALVIVREIPAITRKRAVVDPVTLGVPVNLRSAPITRVANLIERAVGNNIVCPALDPQEAIQAIEFNVMHGDKRTAAESYRAGRFR